MKQHNLSTGVPLCIFKMSLDHEYLKMYYDVDLLHIWAFSHPAVYISSWILFPQNVCMHLQRSRSEWMDKKRNIDKYMNIWWKQYCTICLFSWINRKQESQYTDDKVTLDCLSNCLAHYFTTLYCIAFSHYVLAFTEWMQLTAY